MKKFVIKKSNDEDFLNYVGLVSMIQLIIGALFLLPPILGVIFFTLNVFGVGGRIVSLYRLSVNWTGGDSAMSAAPIYLGLMAIAGSFMVISALKNVINTEYNVARIDEITVDDKKEV